MQNKNSSCRLQKQQVHIRVNRDLDVLCECVWGCYVLACDGGGGGGGVKQSKAKQSYEQQGESRGGIII